MVLLQVLFPGVKEHFFHHSYNKCVQCHIQSDVLTILCAVRGIKCGVPVHSNLWAKRIALLHLGPSSAYAHTNQYDLKWSTNLCTSLVFRRAVGVDSWLGVAFPQQQGPQTLSWKVIRVIYIVMSDWLICFVILFFLFLCRYIFLFDVAQIRVRISKISKEALWSSILKGSHGYYEAMSCSVHPFWR